MTPQDIWVHDFLKDYWNTMDYTTMADEIKDQSIITAFLVELQSILDGYKNKSDPNMIVDHLKNILRNGNVTLLQLKHSRNRYILWKGFGPIGWYSLDVSNSYA